MTIAKLKHVAYYIMSVGLRNSSVTLHIPLVKYVCSYRIFPCVLLTASTLGGHMSILVTTTNTGTPSASDRPRCSFVIPDDENNNY